ncbi:hypothetical protein B841_02410 [Corynebacterium maris DSM 45190]|uniref:VWFA domain-containing protein n=1 Tax=Corynebacterium maris DSM 45190 TaxID=1224163 RepID=S5T0A9_9CORY|nr:vWA domain-containing protein [Corynebacterium maris]AGS33965.1 hypothetical protein B841_02410 [Corynebacterium maris DSM 45190]
MTFTRSLFKRAAATAAAAVLAGFAGLGGQALAQEAPPVENNDALGQFGACMAGEGTADLLIIMDESASLSEEEYGATDADDLRVSAAKDFVSELARTSEETGSDIRVRTAGFGTDYYDSPDGVSGNIKNPDDYDEGMSQEMLSYGGWNSLTDGVGAVHGELDKFSERTLDMYTEYPDALRGTLSSFGDSESPCRAAMMFSDGEMTTAEDDAEAAASQMCSPEGVVSQVRLAGIQLFTVGLNEGGEQDMSVLRSLSEGGDTDCGSPVTPNGQFFEGSDAAGLLAAFRSALPNPGGTSQSGINVNEIFTFTLDNSVSPVSLEAQPSEQLGEGEELIPVLIPPTGEPVELTTGGRQAIGEADVTVSLHDWAPGAVDVEMENTGDWAGAWGLGYRSVNADDASYRASLTIKPGMNLQITDPTDNSTGSLRAMNSDTLSASLLDQDGQPVTLDGDAQLTASFLTNDGEEVVLVDGAPLGEGQPVDISLDPIDRVSVGTLIASANITTAPAEGVAGTELNPVMSQHSLSVSLENMPTPPASLDLGSVTQETVEVDAPVTGPGRVWVESGELGNASLPEGVTVAVDSPADSMDNAIQLERDETGVLPLTFTVEELADGPLVGEVIVHSAEADGSNPSQISVPVRGAMSVPVDQATFWAALIVAVIVAIGVPLAVLYAMRYFGGTIPRTPRVYAQRIPVRVEGHRLVNAQTGQPFTVSHNDFLSSAPVDMRPRNVNVAGVNLNVKYGPWPFTAAQVVADDGLSISSKGEQKGTDAVLPLAIQNTWFVTMNPHSDTDATVVMMVDELAHGEKVENMERDVLQRAPDLIGDLADQREEALAKESTTAAGGGGASPEPAVEAAAQEQQGGGPFGGGTGSGGGGQPPRTPGPFG